MSHALAELARRVEALRVPDREVDDAIYAVLSSKGAVASCYANTPEYTGDMGVAMHLIPVGWSCNMGWHPDRRASCILWIGQATTSSEDGHDCSGVAFENGQPGMAFALVAAALRAQAVVEGLSS